MNDTIRSVRAFVRAAGHTLGEPSFKAIANLCTLPTEDLTTPEFGHPEYLLNCKPDGSPVLAGPDLASALDSLPQSDPPWIRIVDNQLLVLRWLAHFVSLRHRAVHVFLDHPDHPDSTFIQIRSLSKYNQPGKFDMPVAGHIDTLDTPRETACKELKEELGLDEDELIDLQQIGTYNITLHDFQPNYDEVEHTTVFRALVRPEAVSKIRLQDDEVGGLVLFRKDELTRWIDEHPERVGGGLVDSWRNYG